MCVRVGATFLEAGPFSLLTQETDCSLQLTDVNNSKTACTQCSRFMCIISKAYRECMCTHPSLRQRAETKWKHPWSWAASKGEVSSWTVGCSSRCSRTSALPLRRFRKDEERCLLKCVQMCEALIKSQIVHSGLKSVHLSPYFNPRPRKSISSDQDQVHFQHLSCSQPPLRNIVWSLPCY